MALRDVVRARVEYAKTRSSSHRLITPNAATAPDLEVHPIPREEAQGAYSFIPFLNNLAIMFKVRMARDQ